MYILGLYCGHDAGAALVRDGRLVASIQKERLTRRKKDRGQVDQCITYCLEKCGITMDRVDAIATSRGTMMRDRSDTVVSGELYDETRDYSKHTLRVLNTELPGYYIQHHLGHAALAYYLSGYPEASILSIDGGGDYTGTLFARGRGNRLTVIRRVPAYIGVLWTAVNTTLGFGFLTGSGKTMALAPFGQPIYTDVLLHWAGGLFERVVVQDFRETWHDERGKIIEEDSEIGNYVFQDTATEKFGIQWFVNKIAKGDHRNPVAWNLAASIQHLTERIIDYLIDELRRVDASENLCLSGGVALNAVVNRRLRLKGRFRNIYVPPDPSDGGLAAGLALYAYHHILNCNGSAGSPDSIMFQGRAYDCDKAIDRNLPLEWNKCNQAELIRKTAAALAQGKVVGWFQGGSEMGPRALGHRSILSDPRTAAMTDHLNRNIKHREWFRPFAPAILREHLGEYFTDDADSLYMMFINQVRLDKREQVPAIVHVDGSSRPQTVTRETDGLLYDLLSEFKLRTGIPLLINTSFNTAGEPIVETPSDAIKTFLNTPLDLLVLGDWLVTRKPSS